MVLATGDVCSDPRSLTRIAAYLDGTAERLDPVAEAAEARAGVDGRAAVTVIGHGHQHVVLALGDCDVADSAFA